MTAQSNSVRRSAAVRPPVAPTFVRAWRLVRRTTLLWVAASIAIALVLRIAGVAHA
jgi:hypothetical protein